MQNEIVTITKKLVSLKTTSDNKENILNCFNYIENYFANEIESGKIIKKDYIKDGVSSVVFSNSNSINFDLILNGHIDVVNAEDEDIFKVDLENYYIKKFRQIFQKNTNQSIKLEKEVGGSDARLFSEKNIPVIMLMPNCGNTHKDNEWVEIESLKKFHNVLEQFIIEIMKD